MTLSRVFRAASCALGFVLALTLPAAGAWAQQQRPVALPANAIYGELKAFQYPNAQLGKKWLRLSPGARIYDTRNLIITPGMVPAPASVLFRLDINGQISQMWLLTAAEAKAARQRAKNAKP